MKTATHQELSNITGVISKLIGVKLKNSLWTINDSEFSQGWSEIRNIVEEVKNWNNFHCGIILRTRFSARNSPRWIKLGYWNRLYVIFNRCFMIYFYMFVYFCFSRTVLYIFLWFHRLHFPHDGTLRQISKFSFEHVMTLLVKLLVSIFINYNIDNFLWFAIKPSNHFK